jgi:adenylate kinase
MEGTGALPQPNARPKALILFGPPGSGKGTQGQLLEKCLHSPRISTGDMLRDHVEADDDLGREVRAVMQAGMLVPDDLVNRLVEIRIRKDDSANGFILDGYPRTPRQAEVLGKMLEGRGVTPVVVHLKVDYNDIVTRLAGGRRQCPQCGTLYNLSTNPPRVDLICDLDGTGLVARPDDSESAIRRRLEEYESQTRPLLDFFKRSGYPYHEVNGSEGGPLAIANRIRSLVAGKP